VEHMFAQFKKFQILGGRYRGQLEKDQGFLSDVIAIIAGIVYLQVSERPLRRHLDFLDDEDVAFIAEVYVPEREYIDGHPIGAARDLVRLDDGRIVGHGDEPSNRAISTGLTIRDFDKGVHHSRIDDLSSSCVQVTSVSFGGGACSGEALCATWRSASRPSLSSSSGQARHAQDTCRGWCTS
jgi:hypothetical protein